MRTPCVTHRARSALAAAAVFVLAAACTPSAAEPPSLPIDEAPAVVAADAEPPATDPLTWPAVGWYRLDLDVEVVLDGNLVVPWVAAVAGRWDQDRFEWWSDSPVADDHERRVLEHGAEVGDPARDAVGARAGTFAASVAAGLDDDGVGDLGGRTFVAVTTENGTIVRERWEIGIGPAPWGPEGPFGRGS